MLCSFRLWLCAAPFAAVLVLALSSAAWAGWSEDAELCATIAANHNQAIAHCTKAIESGQLEPKDLASSLNNRAYELTHLGRYDEALADADKALKLDPDSPVIWNTRGRVLYHTAHFEKALADFKESLRRIEELNPLEDVTLGFGTFFDANFNLAATYQALKDLESGRPHAQTAFDIAPDAGFAQRLYRAYGLK